MNGYQIEIGDIQDTMGSKVQNSHINKVDVSEIKTSLQAKLPTVRMLGNELMLRQ